MKNNKNNQELNILVPLLVEVGKYAKKVYYYNRKKKNITYKDKEKDNPVSIADTTINTIIVDRIQEHFPEDNIITEEDNVTLKNKILAKRYWIIDPIDGTREFIKQSPEFCISVGLFQNQKPIMGFIYNPIKKFFIYNNAEGEIFQFQNSFHFMVSLLNPIKFFYYSISYFLNRKKKNNFQFIRKFYLKKQEEKNNPPSNRKKMIVAVSHYENGNFNYLNKIANLKIKVVPMGSIAYKLALVAANKIDVVISTYNKNIWDIAAGLALLKASSKVYKNINGKDVPLYFSKVITGTMLAGEKTKVEKVIQSIKQPK